MAGQRLNFSQIFRQHAEALQGRIAAKLRSTKLRNATKRPEHRRIERWGYVIKLASNVPGGPTKNSGGKPLAAVWNFVWFGTKKRKTTAGQNRGRVKPQGAKVDANAGALAKKLEASAAKQLSALGRRHARGGR